MGDTGHRDRQRLSGIQDGERGREAGVACRLTQEQPEMVTVTRARAG